MNEKTLHAELSASFRQLGCWVYKIPDASVSRMQVAQDGKMRFALPKPCDLIGAAPGGRFVAIEAKLARSPIFHVDARLVRQLETLRALQERGAFAALALNFRFVRKRPPLRVNRTLLFLGVSGEAWTEGRRFVLDLAAPFRVTPIPPAPMPRYLELLRIAGGWEIPAGWPAMSAKSALLAVDCICDFSEGSCGGLGVIYCDGCGGDLCVCSCGGQVECMGCDDCSQNDYDYEDDNA